MGSTQSVRVVEDDEEEQEQESEESEEEEEERDRENDDDDGVHPNSIIASQNTNEILMMKKVLQQEPEMLPCHASASPLSPQLSSLGTPRIKVWDPCNVLAPPPPPPFSRSFSMEYERCSGGGGGSSSVLLEVYLICHGESELSLRPDLIGGRCPDAALTPTGKRQARALAVLFNSQGVSFNAVYSSPLDRAKSMALSVCQEMNFAEEQIQTSDALMDMSQGHWEGCHRSEVYTPEVLGLLEGFQPDICAPSGESLREVEFRMVQFLNRTILRLPEKLRSDYFFNHQNESQGYTHHNSQSVTTSVHDRDGPSLSPAHWDLLHRHRPSLSRKKSGKSRLQYVTTTGDQEADDEMSPQDTNPHGALHDMSVRNSSGVSSCVGIFTHSVPIKCLLTGLLGCSPTMAHKFLIDDSSVTVLQHNSKTGWLIKRLNDTAHLRLL